MVESLDKAAEQGTADQRDQEHVETREWLDLLAADDDLGGHIASYASAAEIFEVGFNHFFHAATPEHGGDLVFYQPHSAPGVYARAFLEGRFTKERLTKYPRKWAAKVFALIRIHGFCLNSGSFRRVRWASDRSVRSIRLV